VTAASRLWAAELAVAPAMAAAQVPNDDGLSMGLILGDPTGFTLRNGIGKDEAIQLHLGFGAYPGGALSVVADWTHDLWTFVPHGDVASLELFVGLGAKVVWFTEREYFYSHPHGREYPEASHVGLGGRGLIGLRMPFRSAPFDLFLELAPLGLVGVLPDGGVFYDVDFALGGRYRF
jgi:hypothetical protein